MINFSFKFKTICTTILLFVFPVVSFSQRAEVKLQYRIGIPLNRLDKLDLPQDDNGFYINGIRSIQSIMDQGWKFNFKYNFSKKHLLFFNINLEQSFSKDYLHIFVPQPIENILIKQNRTVLGLGIKKQFRIYKDAFRIELGAEMTFRNSSFDKSSYSGKLSDTYYDWMKYSYDIDIYDEQPINFPSKSGYQKKKVNGNYNLSLLFPINNRLLLNVDFEYTGGLIYYYSSIYSSYIYTENPDTPSQINTFQQPVNYIKKSYLYAGIGISYKFNIDKKWFD